jgi:lipoprotein-anchoring transpeptidase ErfK/SrfK
MPTTGPLRSRIVSVVAALVLVVVVISCGGTPAADTPAVTEPVNVGAGDGTTAPTATAPPGTTLAARLTKPVTARAEPSPAAAAVTDLGVTTALGSPTTLLAEEERDGWLRVSLPVRPNGSEGWIPGDAAEVQANPLAITVDRGRHQLMLTRGGQVEMEVPIADGTLKNPTPAGRFYVTDLVDTGNASGAYGPFALGLSGHSETLTEFAGGDGQLGLHGTNEPARIGQSVSHGCIRVTNDVIVRLAEVVPLGTPVTVT